MRTGADALFDRWNSPTFQPIGEDRTRGIVTCEPDWLLHVEASGLGAWPASKRPVRWWQRADNSQVEVQIPNVKAVNWERAIESDAATCTVTLTNQWMKTNFATQIESGLGMPGFFTFDRGESAEAQSRWQHEVNEWNGRLVPGALLRTYEGYGGFNIDGSSKTREEMLAAGDILLTGVWQVDDVTIGARSKLIELRCRDMMALLLDQIIYPPLVPSGIYPLQYQRWIDTVSPFSAKPPAPAVNNAGAVVASRYETSSADAWYGPNADIHGHHGTDSSDGNFNTYALSVGNSGPDKPFATDYFQYTTGGQLVGGVRVTCWQGGYQMFVSVMEDGQWQGAQSVPYDPGSLYGTQPTVVDTGANIPYVAQVGCPVDTAFEVALPRPYRADRIRISFRHLADSNIGPWEYRAGVREFQALTSASAVAGGVPVWWAASYMRDPDNPERSGYLLGTQSGVVAPFGLARERAKSGGNPVSNSHVTWIEMNRTGSGYWTIRGDGSITAYGAVGYFGSPKDDGVGTSGSTVTPGIWWNVLLPTPTGQGYWAVATNGRIRAYGDATPYADVPDPAPEWVPGGSALISDQGFLLAVTDGTVIARGLATHHGDWTKTDLSADDDTADGFGSQMVTAVPTPTGDGYWLLSSDGTVQALGAAVFYGETVTPIANILDRFDQLVTNADGTGYLLVQTRGAVYPHGTIDFFGSPATDVTVRADGNYQDYADIVKDLLLWSGWFYKETVSPSAQPEVYGNIETTGIYSPSPLPPDMFDKRHPIDPIKQLKEIVGYICWVDDEGAFRWECVDDQTEALTRRGWVDGHDLRPTDVVLGLNPETGLTEWTPLLDVARYDLVDEDLVSIEGRAHSSLTTPTHRWWTTPAHRDRGAGKWETSDQITTESRIPIAAERGDGTAEAVHLDELTELVAWWYTEGTTLPSGKSGVIYQSRRANPGHVERIRACFEKLGGPQGFLRDGNLWCEFETAHEVTAWRFKGPLFDTLQALAPDRVPTPEFLISLTPDQVKAFVATSLDADGHTWGGRYSEFVQKDPLRVAAFEMACVLAGKAFRTRHSADRNIYRTKVLHSTGVKPVGAARNTGAGRHAGVTRKRYSGIVWCPKMERNHVWLARRAGTVYFTGNSPNWWQAGNFYTDGTHTDFIPEIDERIQLTDYTVRFTKSKDRSKIIVTTDEPTAGFDDTITTEYTPSNSLLRGQVIPAMVKVPPLVTKTEQEVFAELIALHMWFARRSGQVTIQPANPALMINDQVRIFERVTAETYIHYVRGISSSHDFETGVWTQTLTTNWLGTEESTWAVTADNIPVPVGGDATATQDRFVMSAALMNFVAQLVKAPAANTVKVVNSPPMDAADPGDGSGPTT